MDRLDKLRGVSVLVIGDAMLDLWHKDASEDGCNAFAYAGGAANAAANIESLGGKAALVGVVGDDPNAGALCEILTRHRIPSNTLVVDRGRPTTTKRYTPDGRKNRESLEPIPQLVADQVFAAARMLIVHVDAVLLSDYGKGVMFRSMASSLIRLARSHAKPVIVDPSPRARIWQYEGADLIKPNLIELVKLAGGTEETERAAAVTDCVQKLWREFDVPYLVTMDEAGMMLAAAGRFDWLDAHGVNVVSETGAGDSTAAAVALGLGARLKLKEVAELANLAGAAAVSKPHTAAVLPDDLRSIAREHARR